jgi:uncharacterized repeat protein (TIGR03837 family)
MRWDIFCQIVDNYGDAGVCWRLARSLSSRDDIRIRLFCDDLKVLDKIAYGDAVKRGASLGIEVLPWSVAHSPEQFQQVGDVVIEAFACELPATYVQLMAQASKKPCWINLEYLTAETWADGMHLMPSPQNNGLSKYFYFPGFTEKTGGVTLGNWDLITQSHQVPASLQDYWQANSKAQRISIFNYRHAPLEAWLKGLQTITLSSNECFDIYLCAEQNVSDEFLEAVKSPRLNFIQLPFMPQEDYDWLLSRCNFNLVRGEDSFVRAQWAGKPFIWDIYPQSDHAHEVKLDAFLERYFEGSPSSLNTQGKMAMKWACPSTWWPNLEVWTQHSATWAQKLRDLGQLEVKILDFVKSQEISR